LQTGRQTGAFDPGVPVGAVAVSRAGGRVAALAYTNSAGKADPRERATVWDVATGRVLARVPQGGDGECLALSPDGALVAVAPRWKGEVRVYAADGGAERFVFRHAGPITGLAFAPDGRTLAVASREVPVTLWDVGRKN
jgi:dipeptidyl aminopeptidase/acylaminoacyl peptidase